MVLQKSRHATPPPKRRPVLPREAKRESPATMTERAIPPCTKQSSSVGAAHCVLPRTKQQLPVSDRMGKTVKQSPKRKPRKTSKTVTPSPKRKKNIPPQPAGSSSRRTYSFPPVWSGSLLATESPYFSKHKTTVKQATVVQPHTLLLGTHPSVRSLANSEYYSHPQNAFWWIAGDCLGFRRATGLSPTTGRPYAMTQHVRHTGPILPYHQQLVRLVQSGFALWDIVQSCPVRPGSLDATIRDPRANDIRAFCGAHPSIRRIVLSNGQGQVKLFAKHFADWMATGQLVLSSSSLDPDGTSCRRPTSSPSDEGWTGPHTIELIPALPVSPAAAMYSYQQKRDFWDAHVYQPGLTLLRGDDK